MNNRFRFFNESGLFDNNGLRLFNNNGFRLFNNNRLRLFNFNMLGFFNNNRLGLFNNNFLGLFNNNRFGCFEMMENFFDLLLNKDICFLSTFKNFFDSSNFFMNRLYMVGLLFFNLNFFLLFFNYDMLFFNYNMLFFNNWLGSFLLNLTFGNKFNILILRSRLCDGFSLSGFLIFISISNFLNNFCQS